MSGLYRARGWGGKGSSRFRGKCIRNGESTHTHLLLPTFPAAALTLSENYVLLQSDRRRKRRECGSKKKK